MPDFISQAVSDFSGLGDSLKEQYSLGESKRGKGICDGLAISFLPRLDEFV